MAKKCGFCGASSFKKGAASFHIDPSLGSVYTISLLINRRLSSLISNQVVDVNKDTWFQMYGSDLANAIRGGVYGLVFESSIEEAAFLAEFTDIQAWQYQ